MKRILLFILVLALLALPQGSAEAGMSVWFLDVGQGDCTIIRCDGEVMVIDGGMPDSSDKVFTFLRDVLSCHQVKYVIATHPHEDHVGGLSAVFNKAPVDLLLSPVPEWENKAFTSLMDLAKKSGTPVIVPAEGDQLALGSALITILHCWPEAVKWREEAVNDMSIVVRIDYGNTSMIVTGDAEEASEFMMIGAGAELKADVLRIGHHGSYTASSREFLKAVSPKYAVISCGKWNAYGHPHGSVLNNLKKINAEVYRTDLQGTICCTSDGESFTFSAEKTAEAWQLYRAPSRV